MWARISNLKPNSQHIVYVVAIGAKGESLPSETLVAYTDPALPAYVDVCNHLSPIFIDTVVDDQIFLLFQPPTVHPDGEIAEGGSMTILCLALGNPIPTISLYVGGHFVRSEIGRHMVTIIHNVTRDMEKVACEVDNGYGTPMQATRKININCEYYCRVRTKGESNAQLYFLFQLHRKSRLRVFRWLCLAIVFN